MRGGEGEDLQGRFEKLWRGRLAHEVGDTHVYTGCVGEVCCPTGVQGGKFRRISVRQFRSQ